MKRSSYGLVGAGLLGICTAVLSGCGQSTTTGPKGGTGVTTSASKKLTLTAAKDQTIRRGASDSVLVTINRDNFNDPVTIRLTGLPKGVETGDKETVIASGSSTTTLTLKAGADAALGEHQVTLSAEAPSVEKNSQTFRLTVKE